MLSKDVVKGREKDNNVLNSFDSSSFVAESITMTTRRNQFILPAVTDSANSIILHPHLTATRSSPQPTLEDELPSTRRRCGLRKLRRHCNPSSGPDSDMGSVKVRWDLFPQPPKEIVHENFSCLESEELFVAGLEEMAPSHHGESLLLKIFLDDEEGLQERLTPSRHPSIVPRKIMPLDPHDA
jgi:hypothetical protein